MSLGKLARDGNKNERKKGQIIRSYHKLTAISTQYPSGGRSQFYHDSHLARGGGGGRKPGWEEKGPERGRSAVPRVSPQMGGVLHTHLLTSPMANFICKCLNLSKVSTGCLKPQGEF